MKTTIVLATAFAVTLISASVIAQGNSGAKGLPGQVADHEVRLGTLEGQNLSPRLLTLEAENHGPRLDALEGQNLDSRVSALENNSPQFPVQVALAPFQTCFDLETGQEAGVVLSCRPEADILFIFNRHSTTPTLLWTNFGATVALLPALPFAAVNASILDLPIVFVDHINDREFKGTDTALVRTATGNVYKVGSALCMTGDPVLSPGCALGPDVSSGVRFSYQRLR